MTNGLDVRNEYQETKKTIVRRTKIIGRDVITVLGTVGALFTALVFVHPGILVVPAYLKWILQGSLIVLCVTLAMYRLFGFLDRFLDITPLTSWLLIVAGISFVAFLFNWSPPTSQLVAQQVLANQGMFLRRIYYKTALEIGNVEGVRLFHRAGFNRSLAFELLGEHAETVRQQRSVEVALSNDVNVLDDLLDTLIEVDAEGISMEAPPRNDAGLERRIRYTDAGVVGPERMLRDGSIAQSATMEHLLYTEGITLLGHAIRANNRDAILALLRAGADSVRAVVPLLSAGHAVGGDLAQLYADPFLYAAEDVETRNDMEAKGVLSPWSFSSTASGDRPSSAQVRRECPFLDSDNDDNTLFVGYRWTKGDTNRANYSLAAFVVRNVVRCQRDLIEAEGDLSYEANINRAILRLVRRTVNSADRQNLYIGLLTEEVKSATGLARAYRQYVGEYEIVSMGATRDAEGWGVFAGRR